MTADTDANTLTKIQELVSSVLTQQEAGKSHDKSVHADIFALAALSASSKTHDVYNPDVGSVDPEEYPVDDRWPKLTRAKIFLAFGNFGLSSTDGKHSCSNAVQWFQDAAEIFLLENDMPLYLTSVARLIRASAGADYSSDGVLDVDQRRLVKPAQRYALGDPAMPAAQEFLLSVVTCYCAFTEPNRVKPTEAARHAIAFTLKSALALLNAPPKQQMAYVWAALEFCLHAKDSMQEELPYDKLEPFIPRNVLCEEMNAARKFALQQALALLDDRWFTVAEPNDSRQIEFASALRGRLDQADGKVPRIALTAATEDKILRALEYALKLDREIQAEVNLGTRACLNDEDEDCYDFEQCVNWEAIVNCLAYLGRKEEFREWCKRIVASLNRTRPYEIVLMPCLGASVCSIASTIVGHASAFGLEDLVDDVLTLRKNHPSPWGD
jgi:hypothetical protein